MPTVLYNARARPGATALRLCSPDPASARWISSRPPSKRPNPSASNPWTLPRGLRTCSRSGASRVLNYREIFEQEFYSCHLGIAKPKPEFFEEITIRLGQPAASILFVDDRMENVLAARKVGLRAEVYDAATGAPILYEILHSHDLFGSAEIPQPPSLRSTSAEAHSPSDQPR